MPSATSNTTIGLRHVVHCYSVRDLFLSHTPHLVGKGYNAANCDPVAGSDAQSKFTVALRHRAFTYAWPPIKSSHFPSVFNSSLYETSLLTSSINPYSIATLHRCRNPTTPHRLNTSRVLPIRECILKSSLSRSLHCVPFRVILSYIGLAIGGISSTVLYTFLHLT